MGRHAVLAADLDPLGTSPAEAAQRNRQDFAKWGEVVKRIDLQLD